MSNTLDKHTLITNVCSLGYKLYPQLNNNIDKYYAQACFCISLDQKGTSNLYDTLNNKTKLFPYLQQISKFYNTFL